MGYSWEITIDFRRLLDRRTAYCDELLARDSAIDQILAMTTSTPARDTVLHTIDWVGALRARRSVAEGGSPKVCDSRPRTVTRSVDFHADAARVDDPGQRDLGGVDPRQTGAMALGAPALAGLADYRPLRLGRGPLRPPLAEASAGAFAYRQGVLWILSNPFLPCCPAACPVHPWAQVCRQSSPRW